MRRISNLYKSVLLAALYRRIQPKQIILQDCLVRMRAKISIVITVAQGLDQKQLKFDDA